jgi:1-acyl-sn-glycerol-3-phosphate acyltransferase
VIEAENHPLFTPFWRGYITNSIRNHFDAVRVHITAPDAAPTPTLFQMTHVSWWDGYLGVVLAAHLGLEHRVMMLEENLSKYRFLRYVGAFSLARGSTRGALESLRYAGTELETRPARALVMFPAGDIGSAHARPAPYQSGAASLTLSVAKRVPLQVRSVAIRLEHRGAAKPEALLRVGAPIAVDSSLKTAALSATLQADLERETEALKLDLEHGDLSHYALMLRGTGGMQQIWDDVRRAVGVKV